MVHAVSHDRPVGPESFEMFRESLDVHRLSSVLPGKKASLTGRTIQSLTSEPVITLTSGCLSAWILRKEAGGAVKMSSEPVVAK